MLWWPKRKEDLDFSPRMFSRVWNCSLSPQAKLSDFGPIFAYFFYEWCFTCAFPLAHPFDLERVFRTVYFPPAAGSATEGRTDGPPFLPSPASLPPLLLLLLRLPLFSTVVFVIAAAAAAFHLCARPLRGDAKAVLADLSHLMGRSVTHYFH